MKHCGLNKALVKRRYVTLMEMLIVIFLIGVITAVVAYNYRGSLEEGKAFQTKAGMEKIEMILNLRIAEDPDLFDNVQSQWQEMIKNDPLVKDPNALMRDGWGKPYDVTVENSVIKVRSQKYEEYKKGNR